jgi:hypothetical protein
MDAMIRQGRNKGFGLIALLVILPGVQGCAKTLPPDGRPSTFERRCLPASSDLRKMPLSQIDTPQRSGQAISREVALTLYSPIAVHIADVMDLLPLLDRLAKAEQDLAPDTEGERIRRKLLARLQLASLEVSSLVAEIECEVQRADHVQDRLKDMQTRRTTFQTIMGVIFGGLANILSGGLSMATQAGDAGNLASVAGGALEVLFGTSANFTTVRQEFKHPHNHLAVFWDGEKEQAYFSDRVWRFLTEPNVRDLEGHSLRDVMLQTWRDEGRMGEPGSTKEQERKRLLLGEGGLYSSDDLYVREAMLSQLESSIQLMHQDLETLMREVLIRQAMEEERS